MPYVSKIYRYRRFAKPFKRILIMKKISIVLTTISLIITFVPLLSKAQSIINKGSDIYISGGTSLTFTQDYINLGDGTITNAGNVDILKNWTNNGSNGVNSTGNPGSVNFKGSSTQTISGSTATEFNVLKIEQDVELYQDISVWDELELNAGKINIKNNDLNYQGGNSIVANSSHYIIAEQSGKLKMFVDMTTPTVFPLGTGSNYTPVTIGLNSASDTYSVNLIDDVLTNGNSGSTIPEINECVKMTWNVDADVPAMADFNLSLQWNASQEGSNFDRSHSAIGEYHTGQWNANANQAAAGTNPYTLSQNNIVQVGSFAVGDLQSPMAMELDLSIDLTAFLEGPFDGTEMMTVLNNTGQLPLNQPYNGAYWNYNGTESVTAIPNNDVVDWVLVETRDADIAANATSATMLERQAAFILKDGSIVAMDGSSNLQFYNVPIQNLFVVIYHRNHLSIMSAAPLTESGGVYTYNFSSGVDQAYANTANGQKEIATGIWGMYGGDGANEGHITHYDYLNIWKPEAGTKAYLQADYNLDGQAENMDKNDIWIKNIGISTQVPE